MKKSPKLEIPENMDAPRKDAAKTNKMNKKGKQSSKKGKTGAKKERRSVKKFFRDIISELKKVTWGKLKDTKKEKGVLSQTGIVLLFVLISIVVLTAVDLGLAELLGLLIGIAA